MSAKFPRGGGAGPFLARSLYLYIVYIARPQIESIQVYIGHYGNPIYSVGVSRKIYLLYALTRSIKL